MLLGYSQLVLHSEYEESRVYRGLRDVYWAASCVVLVFHKEQEIYLVFYKMIYEGQCNFS